MWPALLLLLGATPVFGLYDSGRFTSSAADISAPVFLEENSTWRFEVTVVAAEGVLLVPLFRNLSTPVWATETSCTGFVSLCCLDEIVEHYINEELRDYLIFNGDCDDRAFEDTDEVLNAPPSATSAIQGAFPLIYDTYPRSWCFSPQKCVYEIRAENLADEWFTEELPETMTASPETITDRELRIKFLHVQPLPSEFLELTLVEHVLVFHDSFGSEDLPSNYRHHSFVETCSRENKPEVALWALGGLWQGNGTCAWVCPPEYFIYPATNGHVEGEHECLLAPPTGVRQYFSLLVDTPSLVAEISSPPLDDDDALLLTYHGAVLALLQDALEQNSVVGERLSALHLRRKTRDSLLLPPGTRRAYDRLDVSVVLFFPTCDANETVLLERSTDGILSDATGSTFTSLIASDPAAPEDILATEVGIVGEGESFGVCIEVEESVPIPWIVLTVTWGCVIALGCVACCASLLRRSSSRRQLVQRFAPLATPGFSRPREKLEGMEL